MCPTLRKLLAPGFKRDVMVADTLLRHLRASGYH